MIQTQQPLTPIFGLSPESISQQVNLRVVEQHIDEVASQWWKYMDAVNQPDCMREDLLELVTYMSANLEGIYLGNQASWQLCQSLLALGDEYLFPATILAFQRNNTSWQQNLLKKVNEDNVDIFIGALSWLDFENIKPFITGLSNDSRAFYQYIAVSVCGIQRQRPEIDLRALLKVNVPLLTSRVLQLIGELKCADLRPELHHYLRDENEDYRFWAAWSLALLGDNNTPLSTLIDVATEGGEYAVPALQVLIRITDIDTQQAVFNRLISDNETKLAVMAVGMGGHPEHVPWLIEMMAEPELARLAGESLSMITGVDIEYEDLVVDDEDIDESDDQSTSVNDEDNESDDDFFHDEEDDEELPDYEQDLPVPDPLLVSEWWQQYQPHFNEGVRYLAGQVIEEGNLLTVLENGYQRQRQAAALELALLGSNYIYLELRSKSANQPSFTLAREY